MNVHRDYYYEVDVRGELTLDGVTQDDPAFLDFFFRRLAVTADPHYRDHPFVSRCGDEMNYLSPADTPIVFNGYDGERLYYAHSLSVPMYADRLAYSQEGVLYHWAPVGGYGRITPNIALELAKHIEPWGPLFGYRKPYSQVITPLKPLQFANTLNVLRPRPDNACIGCGALNPASFQLSFVHDSTDMLVKTYVRPTESMQGSLGIVHGGIVALLLDETMGKSLSVKELKAPTAKLNVEFRSPMKLGTEYEIRSWIESQNGRKNIVRGEIREWQNYDNIIAQAEALFITIKTDSTT